MSYKGNNKKRGRPFEKSPSVPGDSLVLKRDSDVKVNDNYKSVEHVVVVDYLKQLGKDFNTKRQQNVYIKLEVGVPEARYLDENIEKLSEVLVGELKAVNVSISAPVVGAIERFVTIHGQLHTVLRAALYLAYDIRVNVNNIVKESVTLKSVFSLKIVLQDEMTKERISSIERRAKFKSVPYYDLIPPTHYQSGPTVSKLAVTGNFKALFDFVVYIIETGDHSEEYLDDSVITQYPVMKADDSNLFQQQEFNVDRLRENIKSALNFIYDKQFLEKNQLVQK